jgi:hypothetical protein
MIILSDTHTHTLGTTFLEDGSVCHEDLYLITHNSQQTDLYLITHNSQQTDLYLTTHSSQQTDLYLITHNTQTTYRPSIQASERSGLRGYAN